MSDSRQRGRPREALLDTRIRAAALQLLAENGFARMSMEEVAVRANTTRATIYLRYPTKALLATAALVQARHETSLPLPTGDLKSDLVQLMHHFLAGISAPYAMPLVGTMLAEEHMTPALIAAFRAQLAVPRRSMIRTLLLDAQLRGALRATADIDLAVTQLVGSYYALYIAGENIPKDWPERITQQVLDGLLTLQ